VIHSRVDFGGQDPITVEVIGNALLSVAETMGITLVRSAFSPNIKERRDCSAALFSTQGEMIAQAEHIPLHLGSMMGVVQEVCRRYPDQIREGDVFIANDPYVAGGTHLPDVTVVTPVFYRGKLVAYVANIAHHYDIGGATPGGIAGSAENIYSEGLRLPAVRLKREGDWCSSVLEIFLLNCRHPEDRLLDLKGQVATNTVGAFRLIEILKRYGHEKVLAASEALLDYAERRLRTAVRSLPDGEYSFTTYLDDDGVDARDIPIRVTLRVHGDQLELDFSGSAPQVHGAINVPRSALLATVYYAVKAALDPGLPANGGFHRGVSVHAPPSTIVNPEPPAAVGARTDTCQAIAGAILGAFAEAIPGRIPAGSNDASTAFVLAGDDFIYVEAVGGGGGARPHKDGLDGIQVHITNTSNLPVESLEIHYPLRVERYEFISDSGGAGRFRGGLGLRRDIRVLAEGVHLSAHGDRHRHAPWGLAGGHAGRPGAYIINPGGPHERRLPSKCAAASLKRGDLLRIETPGGGGYGDPHKRDRQAVTADLSSGKISLTEARRSYGWDE